MLKKEILDTLRSTKARVVFWVFLCVMLYDFLEKVYWQYQAYWLHPEVYPDGPINVFYPSMAGFLSGGEITHNAQCILEWLLPIWCLLFYGDSYIREKRCGYLSLMDSRISRKKYFWGKNLSGFMVGFLLMFANSLINYLLCGIAFHGDSFRNLETYVGTAGMPQWFNISLTYPVMVYVLYMISASTITGLLCCMTISLSMALPFYPLVYAISFMVWYPQISNQYSILHLIQPFLSYPETTLLIGFLIFLIPVALCMIAGYIRRVKCDVL